MSESITLEDLASLLAALCGRCNGTGRRIVECSDEQCTNPEHEREEDCEHWNVSGRAIVAAAARRVAEAALARRGEAVTHATAPDTKMHGHSDS